MAAPSQMFNHSLSPLKGWPSPTALDFTGVLDSAVTIDPLPAGRCVHVHSLTAVTYGPGTSGATPVFRTGVTGHQMAIFVFQGSADFDVSNPGGTDFYAIEPGGVMSGLVATGAYELETTEYDSSRSYNPNDVLIAVANDTDSTPLTGGGCLTNNGTAYTNAVVGIVSRGEYTNAYGKSVVAFWPVFLPSSV